MTLALGTMVLTPPPPRLGLPGTEYDPYAATLAVLALAALLRRERLGAGWLSAGFEAKVFPARRGPRRRDSHLAPFGQAHAARGGWRLRRRRARDLRASFSSSPSAASATPTRASSRAASRSRAWAPPCSCSPTSSASTRPTPVLAPPGEIDLGGSLPNLIADLSFAVEIAAILAVAWAYWRAREEDEQLITAFAASIVAYTIFSKVLSPQYLTWLVPLVALVRLRLAVVLLLVILPLTQAEVYWGKDGLLEANWSVWLLVARNLALIGVYVVLLARLRRGARGGVTRELSSGSAWDEARAAKRG